VGVPGGPHRRPAVLRHHQLQPDAQALVGAVRDLGGRARDLGRHRARCARRHLGAPSPSRRRPRLHGRRRSGDPRRSGNRQDRQLLQSGAVRETDDASLGTRDLTCTSSGGVRAVCDVQPDVPLRADLRPRPCGRTRVARQAPQDPPPGAVRTLCRRLLGLPDLRGDPADRSLASVLRPAAELLRCDAGVPRRAGVVLEDPARGRVAGAVQ